MANLIGTAPNQVPTNGSLGTMAFQDADSVTIETPTIVDGFKLQKIYHNGSNYIRNNVVEYGLEIPFMYVGQSFTITSNVFGTYTPIVVEMMFVARKSGLASPITYKRVWSMSTDTSNVVNISELEAINSGVVAGDLSIANAGNRQFVINVNHSNAGYHYTDGAGYIRIMAPTDVEITLTYTDPA